MKKTKGNIEDISKKYQVRSLEEKDISIVYSLCKKISCTTSFVHHL